MLASALAVLWLLAPASAVTGAIPSESEGGAARAVVESLHSVLLECMKKALAKADSDGSDVRTAVLDGVEAANRRVLELGIGAGSTLAASLLDGGASISVVAAFITTLTMIGTVTLPLEIKELGKKMALLRNGMSFLIAILIAFIMGAIL